jgi:hypothetical protein
MVRLEYGGVNKKMCGLILRVAPRSNLGTGFLTSSMGENILSQNDSSKVTKFIPIGKITLPTTHISMSVFPFSSRGGRLGNYVPYYFMRYSRLYPIRTISALSIPFAVVVFLIHLNSLEDLWTRLVMALTMELRDNKYLS